MKPLYTVIICTRNEEQYVGRCLNSLLGGTYQLDRVQIIVCDGRSTDRTRIILEEYARQHACIKAVDNPGLTAPIGFNLGIKAAHGDYIAILSAHSVVATDWIEQNVRALEEHSTAAGVGGRMITTCEGRWGAAIAIALSSRFGIGNSSFRVGARAGWVDTVVFGAYRRDTFRRFGLFDEELVRNQDDEFNYRINARGGKLWFDPSIRTTYYSRSSLGQLYRQYAQYGYWKPLVLKKCPGVFGWRQLVPPFFILALTGSLLLGLFWWPALIFTAIVLASYAATSIVASAFAARGNSVLLLFLPFVFATVHYAYGAHFLWGTICVALGRKPKPQHFALTRRTGKN
jgi:glycosyltransferase involved in cell wall biosynthesis